MRNRYLNIATFIFLVVIVIISNFVILKPVLNTGFTADEWVQLIYYKVYKFRPLELWKIRGLYTTTFAYYIGILVDIFGLNYRAIQTTNIVIKILATISIYPLTLYVFKRKLLAFLTTLLYGLNYTTAKSLEFPVKGGDYLGIMFMSIFLIVYVYVIKKRVTNLKWLLLLCFLFILTLAGSPIRLYPLAVFVAFIEVFIFISKPKLFTLKSSISRILAIYITPLSIFFYKPSALTTYLIGFPYTYHKVLEGNFQTIFLPFQGISYSILTDKGWGWIYSHIATKFVSCLSFFLSRPIFFLFVILTILLSRIIPKKTSISQIISILITTNLLLAVFFIASLYGRSNINFKLFLEPYSLFLAVFGVFILCIAFKLYIRWKKTNFKNNILFASFIGPSFSIIFIISTWFFAGALSSFAGSQQYYLVVTSLGISLFIASLLTLFYDKYKKIYKLPQIIIIITIVIAFKISFEEINFYFTQINDNGSDFRKQVMIQNKVKDKIIISKNHEPILVFLDSSYDNYDGFYEKAIFTNFEWFMPLQNKKIVDGCIGLFYEKKADLEKIVVFENEKPFLKYRSVCIEKGSINYQDIISYKINNFYAYKLDNFELIDVKQEVLKELNIKEN